MEMRKIILWLMFFNFLFQSCGGQNPINADIVGDWRSDDGALFHFNEDGKFYAVDLPSGTMYFPEDQTGKHKFSGKGEWLLQKVQGSWEIKLTFFRTSNLPTGYSTQIGIVGSHGFFDDVPPWCLFEWKDGEGGQKYIFEKVQIDE